MRPITYWAIEPNEDGGFTNKCKKHIASIIIVSMLAGLIETTHDSSSCSSSALGMLFVLQSTFAI